MSSPIPAINPGDLEHSIGGRFAKVAECYADRAALSCGKDSLSYGELQRITNRLAGSIREICGDGGSAPVAVLLNQGPAFAIAVLAILKAGQFFVPIDPRESPNAIRRRLGLHDYPLILHDLHNRKVAESLDRIHRLLLSPPYPGCDHFPAEDISPDSLCYSYFTSGSTGSPKGVLDTHRNVMHNIYRYTATLNIRPQDRLSMIQSPSFSGCVSSLLGALLNGATLCPLDLSTAGVAALADWVEEQAITVYHSVPSLFRCLARRNRIYPGIRLIRLEGDRASRRDVEIYQTHFPESARLVIGLGATECGLARQFFIDRAKTSRISTPPLGYPVPDVEVTIENERGESLAAGETGEIVVHSPYLAVGYWQRPVETAAVFNVRAGAAGWRSYRSGDLGYLQADGCLHYVSRKTGEVRINGQTVNVRRLEDAIVKSELTSACVITSREDAGIPGLVVYYIAESARPIEWLDLQAFLPEGWPRHWLPRFLVGLEEFPLSADGKIAIDELPRPQKHHQARATTADFQGSDWEVLIAGCWNEVLGAIVDDKDRNLFDLGADSLAVGRFIIRIEETTGIKLPAHLIFDHPTVAGLARQIEQRNPKEAEHGAGKEAAQRLRQAYQSFEIRRRRDGT